MPANRADPKRFSWALLTLALGLTACGGGLSPSDAANDAWDALRDRFVEGFFELHPTIAVRQGRHEYDGQLPDWSRAGFDRKSGFFKDFRRRAEATDPEALDERRRFEREYLLSVIDGQLYWLETTRQPFTNPFFYAHWMHDNLDPSPYVTRDYAPLAERLEAYTRYAKNVPAAVSQIRQNLQPPLARDHIAIARLTMGGLASYLESDIPGIFADVEDEALQSEFRAANAAAVDAFREIDAWLESLEADAHDDYPLGAELFLEMLEKTESLDIALERLQEIGEQDLERNVAALAEACRRLAPGESIPECLDRVSALKPSDGPIEAARAQLSESRRFLIENELVTIPGDETALVDEAPPYMRWNFAYIDIPGPYDKHLPAVYYISPPDPAWSAEKQEQYLPGEAALLFTSVHEVWPGHFLHFMHANRADSEFGQIFQSYAFTEGWAHYVEEMMWEAGFGEGDPAIHIGQLLNALLRDARYLSAIGLHTGAMSVQDAERLFIEEAFQDPGTAQQQALRGTFDPGYLNYTLGKLMIRKLREDWCATRGGRAAWRDFHDKVLSYGGPSVPLLRAAMLGPNAGPAL